MTKLKRRAYILAAFTLVMLGLTALQLLTVAAAQAPYLNLDFETAVRNLPFSWFTGGSGFDFSLDAVDFHSGNQSLRIQNVSAPANTLATASQNFPIELVRGKRVRVTGWIKTGNVDNGAVGIWWRVDGPKGTISLDNAPPPGLPPGSTDWTRYEFERDISPDGNAIWWGVFFRGGGTAWFDELEIFIDGVPLEQGPAPFIGEPTEGQLSWIRDRAIPINGTTPGQGYDDLQPLKELVGNARIVALGEATHGTSEFFRMKHRVLEFLASEMGFTIFSIEANMPEAYRLNDYVLNGQGDPKALLKGMYFWTWNTEEVLDMILWMREFNQSGKGHIEFTGFDMQTPTVAIRIVRDFVTGNDPGALAAVNRAASLTMDASSTGFGVATGTFPISVAASKRVRFSGYIKTTAGTRGYAGLWWRVDGRSGVLAFDNMQNRGATGTRDWARYELELPVANEATNISFGALYTGDGTAWFDGLRIELDGEPYVNENLFDLDFESSSPRGFFTGGTGYQVRLDNQVAYSGRQSLRMQHVGVVNFAAAASAWKDVVEHLEVSRELYISNGVEPHEVEWAIQNARVAMQSMQMQSNQVTRDNSMAQNVEWIANQSPEAKIVLWAHNGHIARQAGAMGSFLTERYEKDYLPIEFAFHDGSYNAVGSAGLRAYDASPSFPGSAEYIFHQTGIPQLILDLRKASLLDPASAWILGNIQFRNIGATVADGFGPRTNLTRYSDAVIFVDHSSPSALLPF